MVVCHVEFPLASGPIRVAFPVPNKTGCAGSPTGASQTVNTAGNDCLLLSAPGLIKASLLLTAAGAKVTDAVAEPPDGTVEEIVSRAPMPLLFGLLPPVQWPLGSQV